MSNYCAIRWCNFRDVFHLVDTLYRLVDKIHICFYRMGFFKLSGLKFITREAVIAIKSHDFAGLCVLLPIDLNVQLHASTLVLSDSQSLHRSGFYKVGFSRHDSFLLQN